MELYIIDKDRLQGSKLRIELQANVSGFWDLLPKFLVGNTKLL